jgi:hypothetical protein
VQVFAGDHDHCYNVASTGPTWGRSGLIGLLTIVPAWEGPLSRDLLTGLIEGLTPAEATAVMARVDLNGLRLLDAVDGLTQLPRLLRQRLCDGFLVNYHLHPDRGRRTRPAHPRGPGPSPAWSSSPGARTRTVCASTP